MPCQPGMLVECPKGQRAFNEIVPEPKSEMQFEGRHFGQRFGEKNRVPESFGDFQCRPQMRFGSCGVEAGKQDMAKLSLCLEANTKVVPCLGCGFVGRGGSSGHILA